MEMKRILIFSLVFSLFGPGTSLALEVNINGTTLQPNVEGFPCIDITGEYPGLTIVPSEAGRIPQICFDNSGQNHLEIHHVTFQSTKPSSTGDTQGGAANDVMITFSHEFPPGPNGVVTARAHLYGFFSTSTGVGAPIGDKIRLQGYFSQEGNYDRISDPFDHTVGEAIESGVFAFGAKKKYLVSGRRLLKGELSFSFVNPGDKLTLPLATGIKVDLGSQFEDRLDALQAGESNQSGQSNIVD
jgi:hypothetical protein